MDTKVIDKVAWIVVRDGLILSTRSRGKDAFYIPGGKREAGESDLDCLTREIREELTVELQPLTARFFGEFVAQAHGKTAGVTVKMRCYECDFDGELTAAAEIAEVVWLGYARRAESSPVDRLIFDKLREVGRL